MSEEIFALIKGGHPAQELENYLMNLPIDPGNYFLILNRRNVDRYSPLHCAIFARNMDACRVLLKYGADINMKCHGTPCLHLALSTAVLPDAKEFGLELFELLISHEKLEVDGKDRGGLRPLHRAAQRDAAEAASVLIHKGAAINAPDRWQRSPKQLAQLCGWKAVDSLDGSGRPGLEADLTVLSEQNLLDTPTSVITHPYCRQHYTCPPSEEGNDVPPENMRRLHVIIDEKDGALKADDLAPKLKWNEDCGPAAMSDVLRRVRPDPELPGGIGSLDGDTTLSRLTFEAALRGAGAVCAGVDEVMQGKARNVFAPVRPPGHHAGPRGLTKGEEGGPDSHGFCFLNNISIGAAYAMNKYREKIKRVAIVDFDVHHGNGTEETVRWLKPGLDQEEFFGNSSFGSINVPRYKPWYGEDDAQNVLMVSIHGYGPRERGYESMFPVGAFYPGSGRTSLPDFERLRKRSSNGEEVPSTVETANIDDVKREQEAQSGGEEEEPPANTIENMLMGSDDDDEDDDYDDFEGMDRDSLILDVGVNLPASPDMTSGEYRHQWRNYFRQQIFTRLMEFSPDLIFISAGFDAHKKDSINSGYIALVEEDFDWVTQGLVRVANSCCEGRVVSALEGGYQIGGEFSSAFAKSVKAHVAALHAGAKTVAPWSNEDAEVERAVEKALLDEAAERRLAKLLAQQKKEEEERAAAAALAAEQAEAQKEAALLEDYVEDNGGDRKRRRAPVDYAKLDQELQAQKAQQQAQTSSHD
eukprot:GSChrysophyteH1.ASY1.ANO1.1527.1 assembled CDS